jgi:hypothetical protein
MNNGKRQSAKNIFSQQPNRAKTFNASVVQDKTALTRDHAERSPKLSVQKNTAAANARPPTLSSG